MKRFIKYIFVSVVVLIMSVIACNGKDGLMSYKAYATDMSEVEKNVDQVVTGDATIAYEYSDKSTYLVKFIPKKTGQYNIVSECDDTFGVYYYNDTYDQLGGSTHMQGDVDSNFYAVAGKTYYFALNSRYYKKATVNITYDKAEKPERSVELYFLRYDEEQKEEVLVYYDDYKGDKIKWDPSTLTLEFNNYDEEYYAFYVDYINNYTYINNCYFDKKDIIPNQGVVNVIIKGENTINVKEDYTNGFTFVNLLDGKFTGDGTLNINLLETADESRSRKLGIVSYSDIYIDGPTINISGEIYDYAISAYDDIYVNSGTINITRTNRYGAIRARDEFHMNDGEVNLNCVVDKDPGQYLGCVIDTEYMCMDGGNLNIETNMEGAIFSSDRGFAEESFSMTGGNIFAHVIPTSLVYMEGIIYPSLAQADTVNISGGNILMEYEESEGKNVVGYNPFVWYDDFYLSNAQIMLIGDQNMVDAYYDTNAVKFKLYDMRHFIDYSDEEDVEYYTSHAHDDGTAKVFVGTSLDISKLGIKLLEDTFAYDGKAKEPKVDLKGLIKDRHIKVEYKDNVNVGTGKVVVTGLGVFKGTVTLDFTIENAYKEGPAKGKVINDKKYNYKVITSGGYGVKEEKLSDGTVKKTVVKIDGTVMVTSLKKKSLKTIKVASNVTIGGLAYKVVAVAPKAFKNNKKIKKAFIGKCVKSIGKEAFAGCKKLKRVSINSTKLKTIGKKAFFGDKKLKKVIIKSLKLKKIGKKAFYRKGGKKLTIKVPKAKKKAYKKLVKKAKTNKFVVK